MSQFGLKSFTDYRFKNKYNVQEKHEEFIITEFVLLNFLLITYVCI